MTRKSRYIAGKKKKTQPTAHVAPAAAHPVESRAALAASVQAPAPKPVTVPAVPASIKYASLPRDLRQVAMLAAIILVLLVVAWLVLK